MKDFPKKEKFNRRKFLNSWQLYVLFALPLLWVLIFCYGPMYGVVIAFKDYQVSKGILGSSWVGLEHFVRFFNSHKFFEILFNTIKLSVYNLLAGMPFAVILALVLHYCNVGPLKKFAQTITYAPHFISTVVMVGMIIQFFSPRFGIVGQIMQTLGMQVPSFMSKPEYFSHIYVWTDVWQHAGWGSIIYLSALAGVDVSLHEAAIVDGATKLKRAIHIDLPSIMPTIMITLILNVGELMNIGFEKVYLMQNDLNLSSSEIIATYVYKMGIAAKLPNYSYGTAIGLFNSIVGIILIVITNQISKKMTDSSLW